MMYVGVLKEDGGGGASASGRGWEFDWQLPGTSLSLSRPELIARCCCQMLKLMQCFVSFFFLMFFFNFVIESSNLGMHNILFMQIKKKRKAVNLLVKVVFSFSWWKNAQEVQSKKNLLWIIIIIILIFLNSLLCLTPHRALQGCSSVVSDAVRLL